MTTILLWLSSLAFTFGFWCEHAAIGRRLMRRWRRVVFGEIEDDGVLAELEERLDVLLRSEAGHSAAGTVERMIRNLKRMMAEREHETD